MSIENGLFSNGSNVAHSEGQSLREFDEKLQSLQKENFNLKLRIFFLEERKETLSQNGGVGGGGINSSNATAKCNDEDLTKYNIDLKVHAYHIEASVPPFTSKVRHSLISPHVLD